LRFLFAHAVLKKEKVIIRGDLNFTLNSEKVWGVNDWPGKYFGFKIEWMGLFFVEPEMPSWRDNRLEKMKFLSD